LTRHKERPGVSVVGLGKLGACTATALASRGFTVIGVDVDERTVDLVNAGRSPVTEEGLEQLIEANSDRLRATMSYEEAVNGSDITLLLVPTPSNPEGGFSLDYVRQAAAKLGRALAHKASYHLVVLVSTVLPGACEAEVIPILEQCSGKRCGRDFGFCYGPEFIALGSVVHDFLYPDFVLIGEYDRRSGEVLEEMYQRTCENDPPIMRMNIVNAELTKLSVNTYVTTKISFANMLAQLCTNLPGADVDVVTAAMGHDARIGHKYLKGAVSYGGPCFPRDNVALSYLGRNAGAPADLAEATHQYNLSHRQWLLERVLERSDPRAVVGVVGLTYRPGTTVVEESVGAWLAQQLAMLGREVVVYDERGTALAGKSLDTSLQHVASLRACIRSADVVVLVNPGPEVASLRPRDFRGRGKGPQTVVDCWRVCARHLGSTERVNYVPLGVGTTAEATGESALAAL
jgi:UDPglucose 6-dehydrogenase